MGGVPHFSSPSTDLSLFTVPAYGHVFCWACGEEIERPEERDPSDSLHYWGEDGELYSCRSWRCGACEEVWLMEGA
jgi:hypothetical protein